MVNVIRHDSSLKSNRMEDICLHNSPRSCQAEFKMESTTSIAPSSSLPESLSRRRLRSTPRSHSSASIQSKMTIWNPVYLLTLLLLLVCLSKDVNAADLQFRSNGVSVSRTRERRSAIADSRVPLQHPKKVRRQQDDDSPSTTRTGSAGTQRPTISASRPSTQEEPSLGHTYAYWFTEPIRL